MEALVRTRVERFELKDSLTLEEIEHLNGQGLLGDCIVPIEAMFGDYPEAVVKQEQDGLVHNGNPLKAEHVRCDIDRVQDMSCLRIYDSGGNFMGIYQWEQERRRFAPRNGSKRNSPKHGRIGSAARTKKKTTNGTIKGG